MIGSSDLKARKILFISSFGGCENAASALAAVIRVTHFFTRPLKRCTILPLQFYNDMSAWIKLNKCEYTLEYLFALQRWDCLHSFLS